MEIMIVLASAAVLDLALGDPPDAVHPVAWMGRLTSWLERGGLKPGPSGQFIYGAFMTLFTVALFTIPLYFLLFYLEQASTAAGIIVAAVFLKLTFSVRGMRQTALKIKRLLDDNKTEETRFELRALVSRDTQNLSEPMLASSAIESVAEGTCDSVVAPLFYFMLFGVPGALAYRAVNTLDSMIGYHGKYEYLGKFASILDDILNFIPARLAALLLVLAAYIKRRKGRRAWHKALWEHTETSSPNAGWPMAAMAGALSVRLEKPGQYVLGKDEPAPTPAAIHDSVRIFVIAALAWIMICLIAGGIEFAVTT
jgi:adenosylcobinamide-phosphate synthase